MTTRILEQAELANFSFLAALNFRGCELTVGLSSTTHSRRSMREVLQPKFGGEGEGDLTRCFLGT